MVAVFLEQKKVGSPSSYPPLYRDGGVVGAGGNKDKKGGAPTPFLYKSRGPQDPRTYIRVGRGTHPNKRLKPRQGTPNGPPDPK